MDFIGLDYIRPDPGDFESVDPFVVLMNIDVPKSGNGWTDSNALIVNDFGAKGLATADSMGRLLQGAGIIR